MQKRLEKVNTLFLQNTGSEFLKLRYQLHSSYFDKAFIFDYISILDKVKSIKLLHEQLEYLINKNEIQLVFFHYYLACPISPFILFKLRQKYNFKIVSLNNDDEILFSSVGFTYGSISDAILTTDPVSQLRYSQVGFSCYFTPDHQDPRIFDTNEDLEKEYDISFIGNIQNVNRKSYINTLLQSGFKVHVFGANTENGYISNQDYVRIIKKSKINLNFTRISPHAILLDEMTEYLYGNKGRPFEISLLGGFTLSEKSIAIESCFTKDEMFFFNNEQDLLEKIKFLLENAEIINIISAKAYSKAINNFTQDILFQKSLSWLNSIFIDGFEKNNSKLVITNGFIISYINGCFYHLRKSLRDIQIISFVDNLIFLYKTILKFGILRCLYLVVPLIRYTFFKKE